MVCGSLVVVLLLIVTTSRVSATLVTGASPYDAIQVSDNGTVTATRAQLTTVECNQGDTVQQLRLGTSPRWQVTTCSRPTTRITATALAYGPRHENIYRGQTCTSDVAPDYSSNSTVPGTTLDPQTRRRMFSVNGEEEKPKVIIDASSYEYGMPHEVDISGLNVRPYRRYYESKLISKEEKLALMEKTKKPMRRSMHTWSMPVSLLNKRGGVVHNGRRLLFDSSKVCYGVAVGVGVAAVATYCPNMITRTDATDIAITQAQIATNAAEIKFDAAITTLETTQGVINGLQLERADKQDATQNATIALLATTRAAANLTQREVERVAAALTSSVTMLNQNLTNVGIAAADYTDQTAARLQNFTVANLKTITSVMQVNFAYFLSQQGFSNTQIATLASVVLDIQYQIYRSLAGNNMDVTRSNKVQYFLALDIMDSHGLVPFIFTDAPGSRPIPLDEQTVAARTAMLDRTTVSYVEVVPQGLGTIRVAHQHKIEFDCNTNTINNEIPDRIGAMQLWKLPGNQGCAANATANGLDPVEQCRCWIKISHKTCQARNGFAFTQINATNDRSVYDLVPSMCFGSAQPTPSNFDGYIFDYMPDVVNYTSYLSCLTNPEGQFQVLQQRSNLVYVNVDRSQSACGIDFYNLFINDVLGGNANVTSLGQLTFNLPQVIFNNWVAKFPNLRTERNIDEVVTYGVVAEGVTSRFDPIVTARNQRTVQCYDSAISANDLDTNIIYKMTPDSLVPLVTTNIYDAQPDCITTPGVCVPRGNLISSVTTTAVTEITSQIPTSFLDGDIVVGELVPTSAGGMTYVVDAPQLSLCLAPDATTCEGKYGYKRWPFPIGYDLATNPVNPAKANQDQWALAFPGFIFNHEKPISSGYYEHPVTGSTCDIIPGVPFEKTCGILRDYDILPGTDMRRGVLILSPKIWAYRVVLNTDLGTPSVYVSEGCPTINYGGGDLTGTQYRLTNNADVQLYLAVERIPQNSTSCGNLPDENVPLGPRQFADIKLPACGNISIQVFAISQVDGSRIPCAPAVTAFVSVLTQSNIIDSSLIGNVTTATIQTSVSMSTAATALILIDVQDQVLYNQFVAGHPDTTVNFTQYQAIIRNGTSLGQLIIALQAQQNGFDFNNPAQVQAFDALQTQGDAQAATIALLQADNAAIRQQQLEANANFTVQLAVFQNASDAKDAALTHLNDLLTIRLAQLESAQASDDCSGFLSSITCWLEDFAHTAIEILAFLLLAWAIYELYKCYRARPKSAPTTEAVPLSSSKTGGRARRSKRNNRNDSYV